MKGKSTKIRKTKAAVQKEMIRGNITKSLKYENKQAKIIQESHRPLTIT